MQNYTLCELRSWLSPNCSTQFNVSLTTGNRLSSHCEDSSDENSYLRSFDKNPEWPLPSTDWRVSLLYVRASAERLTRLLAPVACESMATSSKFKRRRAKQQRIQRQNSHTASPEDARAALVSAVSRRDARRVCRLYNRHGRCRHTVYTLLGVHQARKHTRRARRPATVQRLSHDPAVHFWPHR